jgi:hypothetical protein
MPGPHTYNIPDAADQWTSRTASKEEQYFDKLDGAGVLRVVQRAAATQDELAANDHFHRVTVKDFQHMYPAYVDSNENAHALKMYWEDVIGVTLPSLEQLEQCFFALRERGLIKLDAKAVAREDAAAVAVRTDELRNARKAAEFNEENAYAMPWDELNAKVRGWK